MPAALVSLCLSGCGAGLRVGSFPTILKLTPLNDFTLSAFSLVQTRLTYKYTGAGVVTIHCLDCPSGMVVEKNPDELHWIPRPGMEGSYTVRIAAMSNVGEADYLSVRFSVAPIDYIRVNTTNHEPTPVVNGNCTLVEAILAANTGAAVDGCAAGVANALNTIYLPSGTYHLTSAYSGYDGLPAVTSKIRIVGDGMGSTILQRSNGALTAVRGATAPSFWFFNSTGTLELLNLSLIGGAGAVIVAAGSSFFNHVSVDRSYKVAEPFWYGSGIIVGGTSTLVQRSIFSDNDGRCWGGALKTLAGATTVSTSTFTDNFVNDACGLGGAIHFESSSTENVVEYCSFSGNTASWGGQLAVSGTAPLTLRDSTFTDGPSGAMALLGSGTKTITRTNISGSGWYGILTGDYTGTGSSLTISDSTISDGAASGLVAEQTGGVVRVNNVAFLRHAGTPLTNRLGTMSVTGGSFEGNSTSQAFDVILDGGTTGINLNSPSNTGNLLDFPVLFSATVAGANLEVTGVALAGAAIQIFFTDPAQTAWGHGKTLIAAFTEGSADDLAVGTSSYGPSVSGFSVGTGTANNFRVLIPLSSLPASPSGQRLTALGTLGAVTSEFSNPVPIN